MLPQGWQEKTFGDVVLPVSVNEKKLPRGDYLESGKYPVVDQGQRFIGGYSNDERRVISEDLPLLVFGDHTRAFKYLDQPFIPGADGVKVLKPNGVNAKWLYQIAHALDFPDKGYARHFQHLKSARLLVPPPDEQVSIVAELEKQFTRLEVGVAALRRVQANLKRYRAAVLKAACEGRLVPTEAELARAEGRPFESGQQLLARILNRRKEVFEQRKADGGRRRYDDPSPIEPGALPFTPEGWTQASAESVCSSVRDGTHDTPAYVADGVPLITSKNLLPAGLDFENVKFVSREDHIEIGKRSGVERGDILFAMIGTIGNPVVVETDREFSIKNVGLFKANRDFILSRYLRYWFMSPPFTRWLEPKQRGTTQKFVPLGLLRALVVALPPLAEQTRIVAEVERRLSVVEELEAVVTTNLQRATRLRQSILQKAFTGELI
jgi:type I restriction enzyme S subunit